MRQNRFLIAKFCAILFLVVFLVAFSYSEYFGKERFIKNVFHVAEQQYSQLLINSSISDGYPRTIDEKGKTKFVSINDWTGGFWPGCLWYVYEFSKDNNWKKQAIKWTESLENNQYNTSHHDLGFMMYCSYGNAYRITNNIKYKKVIIQSAKSLVTRYNPIVGCIKSWNNRMSWDNKTLWRYPVIIDNMMNLELLFFASKVTGDSSYKYIAIKHALTTIKNHIRSDYSTFHVVNYDTITGKILNRQTCQGYSDNSTWARGQAWAIYGFTMTYRETGDLRFLNAAQKLADFYMNNVNLPKDMIPYWDFNVNQKGYNPQWDYSNNRLSYVPRDVSAACIVSSALLELSTYLGKEGEKYDDFAINTLKVLSSPSYLAQPGSNGNLLLQHSVGSFPHGMEIDVPLVYADYYYLEALLRYQNKKNKERNNNAF